MFLTNLLLKSREFFVYNSILFFSGESDMI